MTDKTLAELLQIQRMQPKSRGERLTRDAVNKEIVRRFREWAGTVDISGKTYKQVYNWFLTDNGATNE